MDDEAAEHPHHFLHGHVGVIEERAVLMQIELVNEFSTGHDRVLANAGHTIHLVGKFQTVPMYPGRFGQMILEENADAIALMGLDSRPGSGPVEAPQVERPAWDDHLLDRFGNQMEHFDTIVDGVWQISDIGRDHRHWLAGLRFRYAGECGGPRGYAKDSSKKTPSRIHPALLFLNKMHARHMDRPEAYPTVRIVWPDFVTSRLAYAGGSATRVVFLSPGC